MNISLIIDKVNVGEPITEQMLHEIELLIKEYPYFQSARLLYLYALCRNNKNDHSTLLAEYGSLVNDPVLMLDIISNKIDTPKNAFEIENPSQAKFSEISKEVEEQISSVIVSLDSPSAENAIIEEQELIPVEPKKLRPHAAREQMRSSIASVLSNQKKSATDKTRIEDVMQQNVEALVNPIYEQRTRRKQDTVIQFLEKDETADHTIENEAKLKKGKHDLLQFEKPTDLLKEPPKPRKNKKDDIIERFISTTPDTKVRLRPDQQTGDDLSVDSIRESDAYLTETLAQIFVQQKAYSKAIQAFEKLSLKNPEKSAYFAAKINEIKKLINNS